MANEKRLIDANVLVEGLELLAKYEDSFRQTVILGVVRTVKNTPTVDAVEVVYCGECRFADTKDCPMSGSAGRVSASDFCSYGERKDHE